ncbi:hypothetical protein [Rhizobium miluonense]|uniref:hypothetical protein n=1 Tax=Rhizobium miluonense TaxID=411945 RepID=UPI001112A7CC|nr:hypothetical protein [Rhizobium miluonense]
MDRKIDVSKDPRLRASDIDTSALGACASKGVKLLDDLDTAVSALMTLPRDLNGQGIEKAVAACRQVHNTSGSETFARASLPDSRARYMPMATRVCSAAKRRGGPGAEFSIDSPEFARFQMLAKEIFWGMSGCSSDRGEAPCHRPLIHSQI